MSVYKDEKSGTWFCLFRYKDFTGKNIQKKKRGFKTKREVKQYEDEFRLKMTGKATDMKFHTLAELYLEDVRVRCKVTYSENMEYYIGHAILPFFGNMRVSDITPATVRKWQNEALIPHYKESTARSYNVYLSTVFNYGVRYCSLPDNPVVKAGSIRYPNEAVQEEKIRFWTREQFEYFLSFVEKPILRLAYQMLFWTGMRRGELLGLRLCDIDLDNKEIHIVQSKVSAMFSRELISTPKTYSSRRTIGITDYLADEIRSYVEKMYKPSPDDLLFEWKCVRALSTHINKCQKRHDITPHIRLHDLRHSHASLLINLGVSLKAVADRLGHTDESMVIKVYGHLYSEKRNEIADKLNDIC